MKLKERSKMKRLIAIVLGIAIISPTPAQASLMEFNNYTYGNVKTNLNITPAVIQKDGPYFFEIKINNSKQDIRMAYVSLFDCNRRFLDFHRFYVGGERVLLEIILLGGKMTKMTHLEKEGNI